MIGCARKPCEESGGNGSMTDIANLADVDCTFKKLIETAEAQLCRTFDKVLPDGTPDLAYSGRGTTLPRKKRPAVPMNGKDDGIMDTGDMGLMILHQRLCELAALLLRYQLTPGRCKPQFFAQWNNIVGKLLRPTGFLKVGTEGTKFEARMNWFGNARIDDAHLRMHMIKCAGEIKIEVKANTSKASKESRESYHRWVDDELRRGAGALHRLTKRTDEPIEAAVYVHPAKSDEVVEAELKSAEDAKQRRAKKDQARSNAGPRRPLAISLAADVNIGSSYRPCHRCPSLFRRPHDMHCQGCGEAFAPRQCNPCGLIGIAGMYCTDCGRSTSLPFQPDVFACSCSPPLVGRDFCTQCGGIGAKGAPDDSAKQDEHMKVLTGRGGTRYQTERGAGDAANEGGFLLEEAVSASSLCVEATACGGEGALAEGPRKQAVPDLTCVGVSSATSSGDEPNLCSSSGRSGTANATETFVPNEIASAGSLNVGLAPCGPQFNARGQSAGIIGVPIPADKKLETIQNLFSENPLKSSVTSPSMSSRPLLSSSSHLEAPRF